MWVAVTKVVVHEEPSLEEAKKIVKNALSKRKNIYILANCSVDYFGRSSSHLEFGERLIIIKSDGALLIHRPVGHSPVNWQPETSYIDVSYDSEEEVLVMKALRTRPREIVTIKLNNIFLIVEAELYDSGAFYMHISEKEIRDILAANPEILGEKFTTIDVEKKVEPGFIDLYLRDEKGNVVVVEIKRVTARVDAVRQLKKYINSLKGHMRTEKIRGIIAAPSITKKAQELLLKEKLEFKQINIEALSKYVSKTEKRSLFDYFR